jgi:20S proteasome subunit beta 3
MRSGENRTLAGMKDPSNLLTAMCPKSVHELYHWCGVSERRLCRFGPYFIEPVIAGLDSENKPYLFASDFIGAPLIPDMETNGFVTAGTCTEQLFGMCESMWRPGMEPEELFETVSQCLLGAFDRDCLSGWGATVHIICPDKVITRTLRGRMD